MEPIYSILEALANTRMRAVLATIVQVEGSAYRKEGASMLFLEDGSSLGLLSGGCLEADLAARAAGVLLAGTAASATYDLHTAEEADWGAGPGCRGRVRILLEPVDRQLLVHLQTMRRYLERGEPVLAVKRLEAGGVADYAFMAGDETFGTWAGPVPERLDALRREVRPFDRISGIRMGSGWSSEWNSEVYIQLYWPKPRLLLFGAGPDSPPLAALALRTGFQVIAADWRAAYLERLPAGVRKLHGFPHELWSELQVAPQDFVVIMTHNFARDREILRLLLEREVRYAGVLGNRLRLQRLLDGASCPPWLHSPAGLTIAAEGPEEIAVSVLAQLIQTLRGKPKEAGCRR